MKVGLIMPVATEHEMVRDSWNAAREMSLPETPFTVLFNGCEPFGPVPPNTAVEVRSHGQRFTDEADLWWWCLEYAEATGWDWCMVVHDDFRMMEPGWESELRKSEGWRVGLASWCCYEAWDESANSGGGASVGHVGVTLDSMSFGFDVRLFRRRGCVAATRFGFGFGAWDAMGWALSQDYACWRIMLNSWHQWLPRNSRAVLGIGAPGHPEIKDLWASVLPARVLDAKHVEIAGRRVRVAPPDHRGDEQPRRVELRINDENTFITDRGTSEHWKLGKRVA